MECSPVQMRGSLRPRHAALGILECLNSTLEKGAGRLYDAYISLIICVIK
jgi:hypothetical protein